MEEETEYVIKVIPWRRWSGDYGYNYTNDSDHEYELIADSIEKLYERIARDYNEWVVKNEEECKVGRYESMEDRGVKYSDIYIVVEPYSEEKRNATKAYKEIGGVRDKFRAKEKAFREAEEIRVKAWRKAEQEKNDKLEYERLKRKYNQ